MPVGFSSQTQARSVTAVPIYFVKSKGLRKITLNIVRITREYNETENLVSPCWKEIALLFGISLKDI